MKKTGRMCVHPYLVPTQWEQKRPAPAETLICETGCCETCPVCHWGRCCFPCKSMSVKESNWQVMNKGCWVSEETTGRIYKSGQNVDCGILVNAAAYCDTNLVTK